ncbi:XrtA system polysaccharide deacetylase [Tautonia plasticadhaerens]|uniref:Peptidoglycan-N-acetylglucosamine deacetylase n=1 Tax=Tautonia plasticadhaerens TaxID=2527974 RepID=A0A518HFT5_9BACT|nr:XrtA system polysaccharide deacetylase [Tautonia plasticadhaerens]QDV39722.1 Peptidoglycan-N-acetylglucosamine deacetylase [Tautonia plasticadhaerens]
MSREHLAHPAVADAGMRARPEDRLRIVLSFDVEEHHRIEAAAGLEIDADLRRHYAGRVGPATRLLLGMLGERGIRATFFIVGDLACRDPDLVREIHGEGHEIACHGWDHTSILRMSPEALRRDASRAKDALEQITGEVVSGYRAPTFSIVRRTAWAIDVIAEVGFEYDSSIYPVRHDRYGIPDAPRWPFIARGPRLALLELPPASYRVLGMNLPTGGGGYFRLLPSIVLEQTIRQIARRHPIPIATLYFHPWEFDPAQPRLPLTRPSQVRTYVGIASARDKLDALLGRHEFARAVDVASALSPGGDGIGEFVLGSRETE